MATCIMPGSTSGTGTSSIRRGAPNSRTTAAFIVFDIFSSPLEKTKLVRVVADQHGCCHVNLSAIGEGIALGSVDV